MICEIFGYTPNTVADLTLTQFNFLRDYAYRAKFENLLGEHNFMDKNKKWTPPGVMPNINELSDFDRKILALKQTSGKSTLTTSDLAGIKL